jgi:hypothetical protein
MRRVTNRYVRWFNRSRRRDGSMAPAPGGARASRRAARVTAHVLRADPTLNGISRLPSCATQPV